MKIGEVITAIETPMVSAELAAKMLAGALEALAKLDLPDSFKEALKTDGVAWVKKLESISEEIYDLREDFNAMLTSEKMREALGTDHTPGNEVWDKKVSPEAESLLTFFSKLFIGLD